MALSIDQAVHLVEQRALERACLMVLLEVLDFDIDVRRALEQLQGASFSERYSIRVELSREAVQEQLAVVEAEFVSAVALLRKAADQQNDGAKS